ncbi:hypothetical protein, variant [Aphanomyces invadans]|uniref:Uncharacterized protein n=1 Tax=Aphanomyces invadans TaxID=157072 RepID=A0A024UJT6_9STRA|nr:hypothetical protein, variant [Aphanomyces invadans]ETW06716.1 hypothetical protein, variant [Aphanomyces invadans]|eukprot:XP_008864791.1 hypothetical protein, variant [Aphanomyces invadans]
MASSSLLSKAPPKMQSVDSDKENVAPCTNVASATMKANYRVVASSLEKVVSTPCNVKGGWTSEDDMKIRSLVYEFGTKNWNEIAAHFTHKSGRQCHERWKQMGSSAAIDTPKKAISGYSGNFDFTKALAVIKKSATTDSAVKTPTGSQTFRSAQGCRQFPGILGRATPPPPSSLDGTNRSVSTPYSASPRLGKVNKLNSIANKLKIRQEMLLHSADNTTPIQHKRSVALTPVHATPQKQRSKIILGKWSSLYGVDPDNIECVAVMKRPPPPPEGYMPRRIVPDQKRRRHDVDSPVESTTKSNNVPWMQWSGDDLEHKLMDMVKWRYDAPATSLSRRGQFAAVNRVIQAKKHRPTPRQTV